MRRAFVVGVAVPGLCLAWLALAPVTHEGLTGPGDLQ